MELFFQAVGGALIAVVLCTLLSRQRSDMALLLGLAVCGMVLLTAVYFLQPVLTLIQTLCDSAQLDSVLLQTILKAVGIGLIGELAALVCADSGNGALGRTVEILTGAVLLWLTVPLLTQLLELVQEMAGGV